MAKPSCADSMSYGDALSCFVAEKLEPTCTKKIGGQTRTLPALPGARQLPGRDIPQLALVYTCYSMESETS
jgi:hypothetical protein